MASNSCMEITWQPTNCLNCIAWSADSEIAVACDEGVEIFIPKLSIDAPAFESDYESERWQKLRLQVNLLTPKELPALEPARGALVSIGEEQSTGNVAKVGWSPLGLARYRHCALAVLTNNLVLSIWTYDGDPTVAKNWARALIINNYLSNSSNLSTNGNAVAHDTSERERISCRVRSFSWAAPPTYQYSRYSNADPLKTVGCDFHYIAISNDANEIIVCEIKSPFASHLDVEPIWNANVAFRFDLNDAATPLGGSLYESLFSSRNNASLLSWSPWIEDRNTNPARYRSCLAFVMNSRPCIKECIVETGIEQNSIKFGEDFLQLDTPWSELFSWAYHPTKSQTLFLSSARDEVVLFEIEFRESEGLDAQKVYDEGKRSHWNRAAGLAYGLSSDQSSLFVVFDHSTRAKQPAWLNLSMNTSGPSAFYEWVQLDQKLEAHFSKTKKNNPFGTSFKFWGLSSNINNDLVAVCASAHPKDLIEYGLSADRECFLFIENALDCGSAYILTSSAESLFLSITSFIRSQLRHPTTQANKAELFSKWMSDSSVAIVGLKETLQARPTIETPKQAISYLNFLFRPSQMLQLTMQDHLSRPHSESHLQSDVDPSSEVQSVWLLLHTVFALPQKFIGDSRLSKLIIKKYLQAQQKLLETWPVYFKANSFVNSNDIEREFGLENLVEICEVCGCDIPFQDILWAQCSDGHQYVRCGLTLLAIQIPGCSKFCGLCGKRYFRDDFLLSSGESFPNTDAKVSCTNNANSIANSTEEMQIERTSVSLKASLTHILIAGCATCIFCGGKFRDA